MRKRRAEYLLFVVTLVCLFASLPAQANVFEFDVSATQSIYVERSIETGKLIALGTLALDLALGPKWNLTYIHDRKWNMGPIDKSHDFSVTRVMWCDTTATMGVRIKIPEDDTPEYFNYTMIAWRWGGALCN